MPWQQGGEFLDMVDMATGNTYVKETAYGESEKVLRSQDKGVMKVAASAYLLHLMGIVPADFGQTAKIAARVADKRAIGVKELQKRNK